MDIKEAIEKRRAYRSLDPVDINEDLIVSLVESAQLAPSCKNSQPWKFIFVYDNEQLQRVFTSIAAGNKWVEKASMILVVFSKVQYDCIIKERLYYLFDSGMATAFIILRALELGLVAHPIAGFEETIVKRVCNIPNEMRVITLVIFGKKSNEMNPALTDLMKMTENSRPARLPLKQFVYYNHFNQIDFT